MNFIDAIEALMGAVEYRETIDIEVPEAREMMAFAAGVLGYECPLIVPTICIDQDIPEKTVGTFVDTIKIITLRHYDGCAYDQGVLVHELAHWVQCFSSRPYCEKEAIIAQCRWLRMIRAERDAYPTKKAVIKMTGDPEFAALAWLSAESSALK